MHPPNVPFHHPVKAPSGYFPADVCDAAGDGDACDPATTCKSTGVDRGDRETLDLGGDLEAADRVFRVVGDGDGAVVVHWVGEIAELFSGCDAAPEEDGEGKGAEVEKLTGGHGGSGGGVSWARQPLSVHVRGLRSDQPTVL